jgi:hypothetical protein
LIQPIRKVPLSWYKKILSLRDSLSVPTCYLTRRHPRRTSNESRRHGLQRLFFSTFPDGWPGVGLLLLRATLGVIAALQGSLYLTHSDKTKFGVWVIGALLLSSGASLLLGLLTQSLGVLLGLGALAMVFGWLPASLHNMADGKLAMVFEVVMIAAMILPGPGAFQSMRACSDAARLSFLLPITGLNPNRCCLSRGLPRLVIQSLLCKRSR